MKNNIPISIYRCSRFFYIHKMKPLSKFIDWTNRFLFGCWCPGSAVIGKGTSLGYWGSATVIHKDAVIGKNCLIAQCVTIGRNFGEKNVPKIGDNVYIGAGSVVFGEITIGDNVIIGANSVVNKSVPDNCTVAGNPFHIIKENRLKKYYEMDEWKMSERGQLTGNQAVTIWGGVIYSSNGRNAAKCSTQYFFAA